MSVGQNAKTSGFPQPCKSPWTASKRLTFEKGPSIALRCNEWGIVTVAGSILQVSIDLAADTGGENHSAALWSLCLMGSELELAPRLTALRGDITNSESGDFTNSQSRINRQDERQSIAISMARGLDDAKDPSNFVVGKDWSLCHDVAFPEQMIGSAI
jgi:hypothetical protein